MAVLLIVSSNNLDRTIEVMIDGMRYEYWFHGEVPLPTVRKILRHSPGKAINYLKQKSYKVVNLDAEQTSKASANDNQNQNDAAE